MANITETQSDNQNPLVIRTSWREPERKEVDPTEEKPVAEKEPVVEQEQITEQEEKVPPFTYEQFRTIVEDEADQIPEEFYDELSGGVIVSERTYLSPKRVKDDLYILGTYKVSNIGKQISLYYGSFVEVYGYCSEETLKKQVRKTLRHEFRHHMETRAGIFGKKSLLEEDRKKIEDYYERHRIIDEGKED